MSKDPEKVQSSEFEQKLQQSKQLKQEENSRVIPVIEEKLNIGVREIEKGKVTVSKEIHEEVVTVDEPFVSEEVDIQRVAKNISIDKAPEVRHEGDTMIIPVIKEEVIIQKRLVLVEELHITKKRIEEHHPQEVTLRKEEVKIDRK
ncbi:YsnF/AvaK domain-containing protein [Pontibacter sp. MBLB2868]|uniref:YsnF/AvaK domain-containing protein n=1 Tax=Pontibacter sp. MBLB2868 TaxID=3451555 RepID=UPI003F74D4B0